MTLGTIERLKTVRAAIRGAVVAAGREPEAVELIAVSKTFAAADIRPVLETGHRVFGENRVQEAQGKWPALRAEFPDLKLHLIGPLQSNKAADAVALFDAIHTIDRPKIAKVIADEMITQARRLQLFASAVTRRTDGFIAMLCAQCSTTCTPTHRKLLATCRAFA